MALSACGFEPVHGRSSGTENTAEHADVLEQVQVDIPTGGRSGQIFRIALEDRLHPRNLYPSPKYRLTAPIEEIRQPIIIERDASITRYNLILKTQLTLTEIDSGKTLLNKPLQRISSFNVSDSDFATYVAQNDALENGMAALAQSIQREVAAKLAEETTP